MLEFHKLEARKTATERKDFDTTIYHTRGLFGKTLQNGISSEARAGEEEKKTRFSPLLVRFNPTVSQYITSIYAKQVKPKSK